ncbi:MAG: threonine ammonia-lyase [Prolixibacteraceae bacterium]|jgi:threonine dehydratase|nr:threonine ammonia-lyase [Prolixibacteraceae bacterium]MBT6005310.1 threonine ammonia-lyase [Prolixibacteraceae bacterium]MBT6764318.1 threonine ammonia-lyase [Prolixibacteraceae bacterium]MBT6999556.1 threonine ammonia-lyase [Prolixibacteraceae bacterium]MBT7396760.1 threonine ammonia-lyase [Prolixibacteraceae bacterium]
MNSTVKYFPQLQDITKAKINLNDVILQTPLQKNLNLSDEFQANILLKREDLQIVRSYKLRGAFNKIAHLSTEELKNGVVCASAGNHAQGVAYSCQKLKIKGKIYMPATTPKQKIKQVKMFGKEFIEIILTGDTYDDAHISALQDSKKTGMAFIHPFDDRQIIEGQATVGLEILQDTKESIDFIFIPVGGGGLAAGVGAYFKQISPQTKIIGVEPAGAPSMQKSIEAGKVVELQKIDKFVDGAAVQKVGEITFEICKQVVDDIITVPEGKICTKILQLYNRDAIVIEPAGALSITALDFYREEIKGKNVVCIVSGSNNDITRTEEIKERSLLYEGLKHYFIVRFPQRAGALRTFVDIVLGPSDDITHFEYSKKNNREKGPAVIGIEVQKKEDYNGLVERMEENGFIYEYLNEKRDLFQFLV